MDGELRYRIRFTKGSLAEQMFPLGEEPVTIGRSHTCGVRLMEADVSGRHVMLTAGAKGVELEVISARRTSLGDRALKSGDVVKLTAGQSVTMGGIATFELECYRNESDATVMPGAPAGEGLTRFPDPDATDRGFFGRSGGGMDDTGTAGETSSPETSSPRTSTRTVLPGAGGVDTTAPTGPRMEPPRFPPMPPAPGDEPQPTAGVGEATQIIQTRVATPQEMAYMRELHGKKKRRKIRLRLALGGLLTLAAGGVYVWMLAHAPEQKLTIPEPRKSWKVMDAELRPAAPGKALSGNTLFLSYPDTGGPGAENTETAVNPALGCKETVFTVKTRVGRALDVPLQLRLVAYANRRSLDQSREESFADWDRACGAGIEKQARLATDFVGEDPGVPCLRYTYTRKATPEEAEGGVLDWAGVLSFFRLRDTCFVYFREVPSVEELRAEHMLVRTSVFFGLSAPLVQERWSGLKTERQYGWALPILRNSAKELMDKNMDNEWEETEDKLTTILIRTFPERGSDEDAGRLYGEALGWLRELRTRQTEKWKICCLKRCQVPKGDPDGEGKRQDEAVRAWFRSPDDRRHATAQKDKWWL